MEPNAISVVKNGEKGHFLCHIILVSPDNCLSQANIASHEKTLQINVAHFSKARHIVEKNNIGLESGLTVTML